ncbi:MAG: DUF6600 domain-containing protein, partial [Pseudomonadota bacterium]
MRVLFALTCLTLFMNLFSAQGRAEEDQLKEPTIEARVTHLRIDRGDKNLLYQPYHWFPTDPVYLKAGDVLTVTANIVKQEPNAAYEEFTYSTNAFRFRFIYKDINGQQKMIDGDGNNLARKIQFDVVTWKDENLSSAVLVVPSDFNNEGTLEYSLDNYKGQLYIDNVEQVHLAAADQSQQDAGPAPAPAESAPAPAVTEVTNNYYQTQAAEPVNYYINWDTQLNPYGHWVYVFGIRYWQPTVVVSSWQPYVDGNWYWTDYGWTWNCSYGWNWYTHHYGSWRYHGEHGWIWRPSYVWAPHHVSFYSGNDWVGWNPYHHNYWHGYYRPNYYHRAGLYQAYHHGGAHGFVDGYHRGYAGVSVSGSHVSVGVGVRFGHFNDAVIVRPNHFYGGRNVHEVNVTASYMSSPGGRSALFNSEHRVANFDRGHIERAVVASHPGERINIRTERLVVPNSLARARTEVRNVPDAPSIARSGRPSGLAVGRSISPAREITSNTSYRRGSPENGSTSPQISRPSTRPERLDSPTARPSRTMPAPGAVTSPNNNSRSMNERPTVDRGRTSGAAPANNTRPSNFNNNTPRTSPSVVAPRNSAPAVAPSRPAPSVERSSPAPVTRSEPRVERAPSYSAPARSAPSAPSYSAPARSAPSAPSYSAP